MREADERYFDRIETDLDEAFDRASAARAQGKDPDTEIEIPVARDMADRVENILGIPGVAERVRELEGEMPREEAALELVTDFVEGTVGDFDSRAGTVEGAVRTAVALLTEGVVAAPIEGIDRVELRQNDDGTEFIDVYYAGPIRSAGGTAQALSVLVADYARSLLGIEEYRARSEEVERYAEEVDLYDKETGLQYTPKGDEARFIAEHLPVMLDGEATGDEEVSGFRDLERVDTNNPRGGMCLVLAEGIALKAPKIQRYTRDLEEVEWPWLQDLIDGTYAEDAGDDGEAAGDDDAGDVGGDGGDGSEGDDTDAADGADANKAVDDADDSGADQGAPPPPRPTPSKKFLRDLIAGRPVFSHPSEPGGFRLRYGRARNHGFATAGVHPATMHLVDDFLAAGTQIKTERPGKAAGVVPVDSIEGPTVRLANGDVRRIDDPEEAKEVRNGVESVLDLGEYLVNYGEFVENNHPLAPASYTVEWWVQEFVDAGGDVQALRDDPHVDLDEPTVAEVLGWADEYDCPLHPAYTYLWHDVAVEDLDALAAAVADGDVVAGDGTGVADGDGPGVADGDGNGVAGDDADGSGVAQIRADDTDDGVLVIDRTEQVRRTLESLLVEHSQTGEELRIPTFRPLCRQLGVTEDLERTWTLADLTDAARTYGDPDGSNAIRAVNEVAPVEIRERAPTRVGNRMGRPEKSESRELSPAVHTLFPISEAGGSQRSVGEAARTRTDQGRGVLNLRLGDRECGDCGTHTFRTQCPDCGAHTEPHYECDDCGVAAEPDEAGRVECPRCGNDVETPTWHTVDVGEEYRDALARVDERESSFEILKGVKGLSSSHKTPEPIEKGIFRAKHGVSAFKDGTVRYDMTDLPVTSVRPAELDVTAEQFRELGYETDVDGEPLRHDDQLVELKVQDVVLSEGAAEHMMNTADFVDDLLENFYDLEAFYRLEERDDLVGELVFGMAPHTSAAVVGRVVGFTSAAVGYAHPYFHASKRRNCFHPETKIWFRDEGDEWHYGRIDEFVEERLDPETADVDDLGTLVEELEGDVFVPSVTDDGDSVLKPVEAVSRHPPPEHMVRVETRSGRVLTVTPDHELCRVDDGIRDIRASELESGDELAIPERGPGDVDAEIPVPDDRVAVDGGCVTDVVESVDPTDSDIEHTYCLTVADTHRLVAEGVFSSQCDGDEDCVMLLMDGLLNFSKEFLPDKRGGRMDAPLVMASRIDPTEIDDEAHNMDVVDHYPREFYEATREMADPGAVADRIEIGEDSLGTDEQYRGFDHTHDTSDIAAGPDLSAYKTLGSMEEKMDAQLALSRTLRAVDETDVAERIIEYHFLPDLIGNLRAFARQETRCLDCGEKFRRMPLSGDCPACGGDVNLTVHRGSVNKYLDTATAVAEEFGCRDYTKQRLERLEKALESIFENDKNKQTGIADFM